MEKGEILNGAWRLDDKLSDGATSVTWRATATAANPAGIPEGSPAVVKAMSFNAIDDWKVFDLFKREVKVLSELSHPAIPRLYDNFSYSEGGVTRFALAMEAVDGVDLQRQVDRGRRFTEAEVSGLLADLLEILRYLHSFRPPVVHRDVTPKNLIMKPDGTLALVDFSGVQDAITAAYKGTSTVVGTPGYAPLEQMMGKASVRSDLYAAAASAVFLLTHTHPADLPTDGLKLDPRAVVELSPELGYVLDSYLCPDERDRSLRVDDAIAVLRGTMPVPKKAVHAAQPEGMAAARAVLGKLGLSFDAGEGGGELAFDGTRKPAKLPSDSRVIVDEQPDALTVVIPPGGFRNPATIGVGIFSIMWFGILSFQSGIALVMGAWPFLLFQIPFWGVGIFLLKTTLAPALSRKTLAFDRQALQVASELLGRKSLVSWPIEDLGRCESGSAAMKVNGRSIEECTLETGTRKLKFGAGLSRRELDYLAEKINAFIGKNA
ncbi:MAG: serine/threonine-protein kinase [Spirochaetes bacterium]|nr:serine/threonine-protein kinase [Spirochaetota bacterium]